jgi:hypothetical protein
MACNTRSGPRTRAQHGLRGVLRHERTRLVQVLTTHGQLLAAVRVDIDNLPPFEKSHST